MDKKHGTIILYLLLVIGSILLFAFVFKRNLTQDERIYRSIGAFLVVGVGGTVLPSPFSVKFTGKWKKISVWVTAALSGLTTFGLAYAADPTMKVNVRFSAPVAAGVVDGEYSLEYLRANLRSGRLDQGGSNAIIDDLSAGAENLEVTRYTHGRFDLAKPREGTKWVYPIENGEVVIELVDRLAPPEPPSQETLLAAIADKKLAEADILKPTLKGDERKKVSLTVENLSGKSFKLWLCDLSQCYAKGGGLTLNPPYADYDVTDKDGEKKFNTFTQFANESGWFALFIGYTKVLGYRMDTAARVLVTPVDGGEAIDFRLNTGRPTQFNFSGQRFNIQVVPDDEPDSGFRLFDVDLRDLSQRANGQAVTLNGDFADDVKKLVCRKRRCRARRCRCYYVTTKGERIAVGLQAALNDGTNFQIEAPKEKGDY